MVIDFEYMPVYYKHRKGESRTPRYAMNLGQGVVYNLRFFSAAALGSSPIRL